MRRVREPELMDDPALPEEEHAAALHSLARASRRLGIDWNLRRAFGEVTAGSAVSVLDIGTGAGGLLDRIARRSVASSDGRELHGGAAHLLGMDISERAVRMARSWQHPQITWVCGDALRLPFADRSCDIVTCSLMLHHFDPPDVERILREVARVCRHGVVISDLTRSRLALAVTWLTTRMVSRSRVFRVDGPRSVRAAYRPAEMLELAHRAGLAGAATRRQFPFRMLLIWKKGAQ